ncbi:MAG: DUF120 domain-containing protein [Candidatus Altiarchaeota archaeon]|nr:DUF120 domain-containing protein [Candidatus Altiarchaeota archaeon]
MESDLLLLYELCKSMKDRTHKINVSSSELGSSLGMSQQSASRRLQRLEGGGLIKRTKSARGQSIELTAKGCDLLGGMYLNLKGFIEEEKPENIIEGTVARGLGEGAYYVGEYSGEIQKRLGIIPFSGTLNIRPTAGMARIDAFMAGTIKGFKRAGRTFGSIRFAPVRITAGDLSEECFLITPARTHHKDVLELISGHNLRRRMRLSDGDVVVLEFTG